MAFLKYIALELIKTVISELLKYWRTIRKQQEIKDKKQAKAMTVSELSQKLADLHREPPSPQRDEEIKKYEAFLEAALNKQHDGSNN